MAKLLNKNLAAQAHRLGICDAWHNELLSLDNKDAMCDMYLRGIDFCLSNDFPSNDFITDNFGEVATRHGIYVDKDISIRNRRKCVCLGTTRGKIVLNSYVICEIFAKHTSDIEIIASDKTFVYVDVFDDSRVHIVAHDDAKVCVFRYGGTITSSTDGNAVVKIREKNKKTY